MATARIEVVASTASSAFTVSAKSEGPAAAPPIDEETLTATARETRPGQRTKRSRASLAALAGDRSRRSPSSRRGEARSLARATFACPSPRASRRPSTAAGRAADRSARARGDRRAVAGSVCRGGGRSRGRSRPGAVCVRCAERASFCPARRRDDATRVGRQAELQTALHRRRARDQASHQGLPLGESSAADAAFSDRPARGRGGDRDFALRFHGRGEPRT